MKLTPENVRRAWKQHLETVTDEEFARNVFAALPADSEITLSELLKPPEKKPAKPIAKVSAAKNSRFAEPRRSSKAH